MLLWAINRTFIIIITIMNFVFDYTFFFPFLRSGRRLKSLHNLYSFEWKTATYHLLYYWMWIKTKWKNKNCFFFSFSFVCVCVRRWDGWRTINRNRRNDFSLFLFIRLYRSFWFASALRTKWWRKLLLSNKNEKTDYLSISICFMVKNNGFCWCMNCSTLYISAHTIDNNNKIIKTRIHLQLISV